MNKPCDEYTIVELRKLASTENIIGRSKMNKFELCKALNITTGKAATIKGVKSPKKPVKEPIIKITNEEILVNIILNVDDSETFINLYDTSKEYKNLLDSQYILNLLGIKYNLKDIKTFNQFIIEYKLLKGEPPKFNARGPFINARQHRLKDIWQGKNLWLKKFNMVIHLLVDLMDDNGRVSDIDNQILLLRFDINNNYATPSKKLFDNINHSYTKIKRLGEEIRSTIKLEDL